VEGLNMQITSMTYTRGATVNTGNYSSERADISATANFKGDHTDEMQFAELKNFVDTRLKIEVIKLNGK
jgi:hypothetical protein